MERAALQHPLPEEIQKMKRDETICKFCGVSYLIHNEIKALEDKLRKAEEELSFYRGIEEREEKLKKEIEELEKKIHQLQEESSAKDAVLGTLKNDLASREKEIERIMNLNIEADKQLAEVTNRCEQYRLGNILYRNKLPSIIQQIKEHKSESVAVGNLVAAQNTVFREECRLLQDKINDIIKEKTTDVSRLQDRLHELEQCIENHEQKESQMQTQLEEALEQVNQLTPAAAQRSRLEEQTEQLNSELKDFRNQLEEATTKNRTLTMENDQKNEQIKKYIQDLEVLNARNRQKVQELQDCTTKCSRFEREVSEREHQLQLLKMEMDKMKQEYEERQARLQQTASASTSQTADLKEAVSKLSGDMEALKKEREMMITAHQNQIEQLRESFRSRIAEADKWPEKLEAALKKEREKHAAAMLELESRLKENFIMELQIEKQKHQELLQKYHNDARVDESQVKRQIDNVHNQYKAEISELHKQIAENKARSRATENSLRDEVSSLKKIINDLEERLARVDTGAETKVLELKHQLHTVQSELDQTKRDLEKQRHDYAAAKEEITFLEETVRKECEERFELTEALSQAKEELLALKKPPGGYSRQQAWAGSSRGSSASSNPKSESSKLIPVDSTNSLNTSRSEEIAVYKKLAMNRPQPPSVIKDPASERESVSLSSVGFEGQPANKTVARGLKGASLNESRRRISQVLGRR